MKKKNLEKAIILGLILSTGVYGTAWADAVGITADGSETTLTKRYEHGGLYIDYNYPQLGDAVLAKYETVKITVGNDATKRFEGIYLTGYTIKAPDTDFEIILNNNTQSGDGIYLSSKGADSPIVPVYFEIGNYNANISAPNSNAFTMSEAVSLNPEAKINGDFTADVLNGSGINVNSSYFKDIESRLTVEGSTTINLLDAQKVQESTDTLLVHILNPKGFVEYDPAAVYAGDSRYNFTIDKLFQNNNDWVVKDQHAGNSTLGKSTVNLIGKTTISINDIDETDKAYGIFAGKNGEVNVNDVEITTHNKNSIGITAQNKNLIYDDEILIKLYADSLGIAHQWYPSLFPDKNTTEAEAKLNTVLDTSANKYGSVVTMNGENNTITMENGGKALYADAKNKADGDEKVIIQSGASGIGTLDIKGDIVAANSGKINLTVNKAADITGDIEATNGGTIDFKLAANADMIVSGEDNTLINAGASTKGISLMADEAASGTTGNVQAANGGVINITLGEGAYFAGRVDDYADAGNGNWNNQDHQTLFDSEFAANVESSGTVNMTINGGAWNLTEQSWVTKLNGTDATIYLDGDGTGGHALHIGTLTGGTNNFVMNVRPDVTGDMLYVKNGSGTAQNLVINNAKEVLENMKEGDVVRFATVAEPGNGFASGDIMSPAAQTFGRSTTISDQGLFDVDFDILYTKYGEEVEGDLGTDEAYNGTAFDENKAGTDYIDNTYGGANAYNVNIKRKSVTERNQSDAAKTIINMSKVNYNNAIYMDRLNKRLGEARYISPEDEQGMWVRIRHDRIGKDDAFRSQNTMYEMGYDVKQDCDNGERRVGMAIDYMDGKAEYTGIAGDGDVKRYGLWLYDTWLGNKGHYTDYVLKWGHLENDFDIMARTTGEKITGDYSNNVFSASAEYGKKNDMGGGWYFEPQAQLQFARVTGADYVTSQDTKVSLDGINSLIGRAGFRLGRDLNENSTVYIKADLLHEFLGDQDITATDITGTLREEYENKGTWYDVGFGFATALGKSSYAFMDFEKSFGNDNDETYQINAGVQWTF
ncbi:outer membrane autotransporter barrel domain protein [Phascolarctobacterium sp. CAG:266]|nr:outer membrane autotransporter barrel domain protein [Phascolarctobacterium sp. CAG:266]